MACKQCPMLPVQLTNGLSHKINWLLIKKANQCIFTAHVYFCINIYQYLFDTNQQQKHNYSSTKNRFLGYVNNFSTFSIWFPFTILRSNDIEELHFILFIEINYIIMPEYVWKITIQFKWLHICNILVLYYVIRLFFRKPH